MWMGTRKISFRGGPQWFWWSRPHGFCWRIFLFSQWNLFILWPQHLHGCPKLTLMRTTRFLFIYSLLTWDGKKNMPMLIQPRRFNERKEGRIFRNRTSARVKALVMVLYWTNHGTTGVVDQRGHKTPTLAMGTPQLCQQGNGDRRKDERILLEGEDNTRWFCSVQFSCEPISFCTKWYILLQERKSFPPITKPRQILKTRVHL